MYIGWMLFDANPFESVSRNYLMYRVGILLLHLCEASPTAMHLVYKRYRLLPVLEFSVAAYAVIVEFWYALSHQE